MRQIQASHAVFGTAAQDQSRVSTDASLDDGECAADSMSPVFLLLPSLAMDLELGSADHRSTSSAVKDQMGGQQIESGSCCKWLAVRRV